MLGDHPGGSVDRRHLTFLFLTMCSMIMASAAPAQTDSFQEMQQGKQALTQGKFDEAIQHFEHVIQLTPANLNADLYIGSAYAQKYVPGLNKEENLALANQAIQYYQTVLDRDSFSTLSIPAAKGIALLYAQMSKFDEAKEYYSKAKGLDPKDPQPFYYTGLVDWTVVNQARTKARNKLGLKATEFLADKDQKVCIEVRGQNWSVLDEGIENLTHALKLDPHYEEAMSSMNLIYLERADLECDDPAARKSDLKTAADWTQKLQSLKQFNATHPKKKDDEDDNQ